MVDKWKKGSEMKWWEVLRAATGLIIFEISLPLGEMYLPNLVMWSEIER